MIPAIFTVGEAVSHEAHDLQFKEKNEKLSVDCKIRGVKFRGSEAPADYEKYAFVVRNKTTGRLKVVVRQPLLFRPFKEDKEATRTSTKPLERTALVEAFGSGKKLRTMRERLEREAVAGKASEVEAVVEAVTKEAKDNSEAKTTGQHSNVSVLPPLRDANALEPSEVYDLDALLPTAVQMALKEEADELAGSSPAQRLTWQQEASYSELVLSQLQYLPTEPEAKLTKATQIAFLHRMLQLHKTSAAALRTSSALSNFPPAVAQYLLRSFTLLAETPTRRVRCCPNWMKEKLLYHILILLLHLDNYKTEIQGVITHFKMSSVRLTRFFQAVGCKIETDKATDKKFAVLRTPVTFPDKRLKN